MVNIVKDVRNDKTFLHLLWFVKDDKLHVSNCRPSSVSPRKFEKAKTRRDNKVHIVVHSCFRIFAFLRQRSEKLLMK
jgi:hypothetical protein